MDVHGWSKDVLMLKVKRTKQPTMLQIKNMALNLGARYNKYSNILVEYRAFRSSQKAVYGVYIETITTGGGLYLGTWKKLQDKYFKLMK